MDRNKSKIALIFSLGIHFVLMLVWVCDAFNTRSSVYAADFNGVYGWLARITYSARP